MGKIIEAELFNWVKELETDKMNQHEITMLNILLQNTEEIAKVGTAAGKRAKLIAKKIEDKKCLPDNCVVASNGNVMQDTDIAIRINSLKVESFRGFTFSREFDFSKQYSFFYGPNGSGKSSLSEALEYGLLGVIEEADSRNIKLDKYIKNAVTGKANKPMLMCLYADGERQAIPNLGAYRFSFIEKNRIDKFSHLDASKGKTQSERIAALFGMSDFNDFVRDFTDSFDKYIKLEPVIKNEFEKSKEKFENAQKKVIELTQKLKHFSEESKNIISKLNKDEVDTLEDAINYINGEDGVLRQLLIQKNEKHIKEIEDEKIDNITQIVKEILDTFTNVLDFKNKLANVAMQSNFEALYQAIVGLDESENCPACGTPLSCVSHNPYAYAKQQLESLKHLKEYRDNIDTNSKEAVALCKRLKKELETNLHIKDIFGLDVAIVEGVQDKDFAEYTDFAKALNNELVKFYDGNKDLSILKEKVKNFNEVTRNQNALYELKIKEMSEILDELQQNKANTDMCKKEIKELQDNIANFMAENKDKLELINKEKVEIDFNEKMSAAYESIRKKLVTYNSEIPLRMSKNLSEKVAEYYNIINNDDAKFEKVETIQLPNSADERIIITFLDGTQNDALQVLSEGHIKILGLSILLAKCTFEKLSFLIFDDIVNAIDDDHRDGVAELLINHQDFSNVQIILTCHGDQFITKLEDKLGTKRSNEAQRFVFIPADSLEERGVVVEYTDPKYPLRVAQDKYKVNELKDAASKCRQALECITNNLWKKITVVSNSIKVAMRAPKSNPDLASVVDALIEKTKKIDGATKINELLVEMKGKYNWMLINKGTHFENEQKEFERSDIKQLIELLENIDNEVRTIKFVSSIQSKTN